MALTDLGSLTDAIPLLDDNGSGVYIKGRNDISDIRRQLLGGLFAKAGGAFTPRPGVLATNYDSVNKNWTDKRVSAQASPNQQVTLGAGRSVVGRTNQGLYLVSQESDLTASLPAADGTNPRYDVVYELPYDKGVGALGDALHGPRWLCETGVPAGSPVVPSVPANANILAVVFRRTTGATPSGNVIQPADIADKRKGSSLHGAPRILLPGDLLADTGGYHGEIRMRTEQTGVTFVPTAFLPTYKVMQDVWDQVGATWRGSTPANVVLSTNLTGGTGFTNGSNTVIGSLTVPDPGYPFRIHADMFGGASLNPQTSFEFRIRTGGAAGTHQFNSGAAWICSRNGDPGGNPQAARYGTFSGVSDNSYTGSQTFTATATGNFQNAVGGADILAITNGLVILVLPA